MIFTECESDYDYAIYHNHITQMVTWVLRNFDTCLADIEEQKNRIMTQIKENEAWLDKCFFSSPGGDINSGIRPQGGTSDPTYRLAVKNRDANRLRKEMAYYTEQIKDLEIQSEEVWCIKRIFDRMLMIFPMHYHVSHAVWIENQKQQVVANHLSIGKNRIGAILDDMIRIICVIIEEASKTRVNALDYSEIEILTVLNFYDSKFYDNVLKNEEK